MSYSKKLEEFVLSVKGGVFFLSPREKLFLKMLDEMGIPEEVVREGVEECYRSINPKRRSKHPLFLCFNSIMERYENHLRLEAQKIELDWKGRFKKKLGLVKHLIETHVQEPTSEEEAERILRDIETSILRKLWKKLSPEERERIMSKFEEFKENREIFGELIKNEVRRTFGVPRLSLYVD